MDDQSQTPTRSVVRGSQLVCLALLMGQAIYAMIIVALPMIESLEWEAPLPDPELQTMLAIVGVGVGVVSLPAAFALRKIMWRNGAGGSDEKLLQAFSVGNLTFQAVLETAGLLNLTLWLATGNVVPYAPVFAVVLIIGVVALVRSHPPVD